LIRKEFFDGGFPMNRRAPVICSLPDGDIRLAYNRYDLKNIIDNEDIINCTGVWHGKKNTDCFILDPDSYCKYAPPENYKEIDSAEEVTVFLDSGIFDRIEFKPSPWSDDQRLRMTRNEKVYQYLLDAGLRFKRSFV